MQSRLTQATNVFARSTLADLCDPEKVEPTNEVTSVDMEQTSLVLERSQFSRIFQAPLHRRRNRVTTLPLVFFLRYVFNLPCLIRKGCPVLQLDTVPIEDLVNPPRNDVGHVVEVCSLNRFHRCGCTSLLSRLVDNARERVVRAVLRAGGGRAADIV